MTFCGLDLDTWSQILSIVQNIVLSLTGIITVVIASKGLNAWRKELKGKYSHDTAKNVLRALYRLRNSFSIVRNAFIFSSEYPAEWIDSDNRLKSENEIEGTTFVYNNRMKFVEDALREFQEQAIDAEVNWGMDFQMATKPLMKCIGKLKWAIFTLLETKRYPNDEFRMKRSAKADEGSVLYYIGENSELDAFTGEINLAVSQIENLVKKKL